MGLINKGLRLLDDNKTYPDMVYWQNCLVEHTGLCLDFEYNKFGDLVVSHPSIKYSFSISYLEDENCRPSSQKKFMQVLYLGIEISYLVYVALYLIYKESSKLGNAAYYFNFEHQGNCFANDWENCYKTHLLLTDEELSIIKKPFCEDSLKLYR